jgi:hypothetical protein
LRIDDETTALDFDLACTSRLLLFDNEKEKRMIEALATGSTNMAVNAITAGFSKAQPAVKPNHNLPRQ